MSDSKYIFGKRAKSGKSPQKLYKRDVPTGRESKINSFRGFGTSILSFHKPMRSGVVSRIEKPSKSFWDYRRLLAGLGIINETLHEKKASDELKAKGAELQAEYDAVIGVSRRAVSPDSVMDRIDQLMTREPLGEEKEDEMQMDIDAEDGKGDAGLAKALLAAREAPIPQSELSALQKILNGPATHEVVKDKFSIDMTRAKIVCLRPSTWLNDEVINFYMSMLQERDTALTDKAGGESARRTSHYFSSFFLDRLTADGKYNFTNVKRWTRKFDVFAKDKIFMPVNLHQTHWTMLVVYVQKKEIHYYDSMSGSGTFYLSNVLDWLADEMKEKKQAVLNKSEWKLVDREKHVPQQRNGVDCGVFSTVCADFLSDDLPLTYSQADMPEYRKKIGAAILRGNLMY